MKPPSGSNKTNPIKLEAKRSSASSFTEPGPNSLMMLFLLFTLFDIPKYDICDTQKHPANRVNRSCFAEKVNVFRRILEKKMEV